MECGSGFYLASSFSCSQIIRKFISRMKCRPSVSRPALREMAGTLLSDLQSQPFLACANLSDIVRQTREEFAELFENGDVMRAKAALLIELQESQVGRSMHTARQKVRSCSSSCVCVLFGLFPRSGCFRHFEACSSQIASASPSCCAGRRSRLLSARCLRC